MKRVILIAAMAMLAAPFAARAEIKDGVECSGIQGLIVGMKFVMKQENDWGTIYVGEFWHRMTYEQKESVATVIAKCMTKYGAVRIKDGYTGKQVASYRPLFHFSVE